MWLETPILEAAGASGQQQADTRRRRVARVPGQRDGESLVDRCLNGELPVGKLR